MLACTSHAHLCRPTFNKHMHIFAYPVADPELLYIAHYYYIHSFIHSFTHSFIVCCRYYSRPSCVESQDAEADVCYPACLSRFHVCFWYTFLSHSVCHSLCFYLVLHACLSLRAFYRATACKADVRRPTFPRAINRPIHRPRKSRQCFGYEIAIIKLVNAICKALLRWRDDDEIDGHGKCEFHSQLVNS